MSLFAIMVMYKCMMAFYSLSRLLVFLWVSGRALHWQRKRLWVQFPGNTHTDKKCIAWMHCKLLWKASAKCIKCKNVKCSIVQPAKSCLSTHLLTVALQTGHQGLFISAVKLQTLRPYKKNGLLFVMSIKHTRLKLQSVMMRKWPSSASS